MALVVWWRYRPDRIFAFNPLEVCLTVAFFCLSMYLGYYSTPSPHTASVAARNASVWVRSQRIDTVPVQPNSALNFPLSGDFLFYHKGFYLDWISLYR